MQKYKVLLFGGDRLKENGPLSSLAIFLKKNKIKFLIITDIEHFNKKVNRGKVFKDILKEKSLNFVVKKKIKLNEIKSYIDDKTIGISINSIWKFDKEIIKLFNGRLFNYHAADLPTERGAANITWRILMSKIDNISINIHEVEKNFDTGDIIDFEKIKIKNNLKLPCDHLKKIKYHEDLMLKRFITNKKKTTMKKKQKGDSYYWPRLNSDIDGKINWDWSAKDIVLFIKGFSHPFSGAYSFIKEKKVKIFDARIKKSKYKFHPFQNGIIFRIEKNCIYVASQNYEIIINLKDIKNFGKNPNIYLGKKFENV
jgi:methionyl-tRNA formyltransferase